MILTIDTNILGKLSQDGDKILMDAEGEKTLVSLYQIADLVEQAIHDAKEKIKESALALDPNFLSIQGDKVKVSYRAYGARFSVDSTLVDQLPKEMYKVKTTYSPEADQVEAFINEKGGLPIGINENVREKQIQVTIKKDKVAK